MDLATVVGVVLGLGLTAGSILMGGSLTGFINLPGLMIVLGGTVAATLIRFPLPVVMGAGKVAKKAFMQKGESPLETVSTLVEVCTKARKEGVLALDGYETNDSFLKKAVELLVDGLQGPPLRSALTGEMEFLKERHKRGQKVFKGMGASAPAFGMIGTLIGLVQMLTTLDDPSKIGPGMAVALLTTFYGALLANLIFIPIAEKLEDRSKEETLRMEMVIEGIVEVIAGGTPSSLERKLLSFLEPKQRIGLQQQKAASTKKAA